MRSSACASFNSRISSRIRIRPESVTRQLCSNNSKFEKKKTSDDDTIYTVYIITLVIKNGQNQRILILKIY